MKIVKPSDADIDRQLGKAADLEDEGRNPFFGMTYAQGVKDAIDWMLNGGTAPLDEE